MTTKITQTAEIARNNANYFFQRSLMFEEIQKLEENIAEIEISIDEEVDEMAIEFMTEELEQLREKRFVLFQQLEELGNRYFMDDFLWMI